MTRPAWYTPPTPEERAELQRLFAKATGLQLTLPPDSRDDPAAWLATFDAVCHPHVLAMQVATSGMGDAARTKFVYDPLDQKRKRGGT